ncbi:S41 family peptidase [Maribacter sp. 2210JD10-5]|uniref:S41 family peptidase n=1 Tax=Maribacter sp. 2210JD10-5 TaxID=3386272 RepID=UPI0039BCEDB7
MKKYFLSLLVLGVCFSACNKENDDPVIEQEEEQVIVKSVADYPVQDFMWKAMNTYYFWQEDVTDLADTKDDDAADYADFLSSENNPSNFFYKICNEHVELVGEQSAIDRFSFLAENYKDLVSNLQGISKSNGLEFQLFLFQDSDDVYGVVTYIAKNSDASNKDIARGDIFIGVDGQRLNRTNFRDLLFGSNDTYTLTMAEISGGSITENDKEVELTKEENFSENPILVSKVIEQNGIKIGYLMYNSFLAAFDEELNEVFGDFKRENVKELVLDFRYNGGGRVSSAIQIASSVYGAKTDEIFLRPRFNSKLQPSNGTPDNFIATTIDGTVINELNLSRVFIIATDRTASASELVINGLEPYVDVQQVGTTTVGKNEFSVTMVDDPSRSGAPYIYTPSRESFINPDSQWGIQPLLGRNENADGFSDYTAGLAPDFELREDVSNLGVLGDPSEPLLELALSQITGSSAKNNLKTPFEVEFLMSSVELKPTNNMALMDGLMDK